MHGIGNLDCKSLARSLMLLKVENTTNVCLNYNYAPVFLDKDKFKEARPVCGNCES